ncbi:MAG: fibronectin type III domain-containing protein [Chloroflexi bacterium]|nr:fibronectin type III domain-containing protein [Chloroflexota bacterium]
MGYQTAFAQPSISDVRATNVTATTATIVWETSEAGDSVVNYGASAGLGLSASSSSLVTEHSVTLAGLSQDTRYFFLVRSTNAGGETAISNNGGVLYRFTTKGESAAPVISEVAAIDITTTRARITWETDEPSNSAVRFGTSPMLGSSASSAALVTKHSIIMANLRPGADYLFEVQSTDGDGNTARDDDDGSFYSFTTAQTENVKRAFVGVAAEISDSSMTLVREGSGQRITILLPDTYALKLPGGPRAGEFKEGARVVILAELLDNGEWVALTILVKPSKPNPPAAGVVVDVSEGQVTVMGIGGNTQTFELALEVANPSIGDLVTAFVPTGGKARGLVKSEDVRERVQGFLEDFVEGELALLPTQGSQAAEQQIELLSQTLQQYGNQELEIIELALDRAPEDKKPDLLDARNRVNLGRQIAQQTVERARSIINENNTGPGRGR